MAAFIEYMRQWHFATSYSGSTVWLVSGHFCCSCWSMEGGEEHKWLTKYLEGAVVPLLTLCICPSHKNEVGLKKKMLRQLQNRIYIKNKKSLSLSFKQNCIFLCDSYPPFATCFKMLLHQEPLFGTQSWSPFLVHHYSWAKFLAYFNVYSTPDKGSRNEKTFSSQEFSVCLHRFMDNSRALFSSPKLCAGQRCLR